MAKHLSEKDIADIVGLIDSWHFDVKLTWEKLCEQMSSRLGLSHSRQTIQSYHRIKKSFQDKKNELRSDDAKAPKTPASLSIAANKIARLEAENIRLKKENNELLSQFVIWQYNAYAHGISIAQLNTPLPKKKDRYS
ncbi:hypothetical protein CJF24_21605 [Aeromonas veronii]|uniref:Transposase n=1 Tax=Aeromonas veronii TaxID=654 RepID=A0ABY3MFU6_AERVE|nr:hypothetical protein [Aeromonas veronii]RDU78046.1 hypothetical protein CGZ76_22315 [Aeromonas veronii]TEY43923.1 hypothetical protein CIG14_22195 [Aeromonas veronii]TEY71172.1 hypothetical protein CIG16_21795 [Aeromonas veronii]TYD39975.1 hypothetical protein CJF24_21605 [Aeromonas veronii]